MQITFFQISLLTIMVQIDTIYHKKKSQKSCSEIILIQMHGHLKKIACLGLPPVI